MKIEYNIVSRAATDLKVRETSANKYVEVPARKIVRVKFPKTIFHLARFQRRQKNRMRFSEIRQKLKWAMPHKDEGFIERMMQIIPGVGL